MFKVKDAHNTDQSNKTDPKNKVGNLENLTTFFDLLLKIDMRNNPDFYKNNSQDKPISTQEKYV